jgi:hypothetical protein
VLTLPPRNTVLVFHSKYLATSLQITAPRQAKGGREPANITRATMTHDHGHSDIMHFCGDFLASNKLKYCFILFYKNIDEFMVGKSRQLKSTLKPIKKGGIAKPI